MSQILLYWGKGMKRKLGFIQFTINQRSQQNFWGKKYVHEVRICMINYINFGNRHSRSTIKVFGMLVPKVYMSLMTNILHWKSKHQSIIFVKVGDLRPLAIKPTTPSQTLLCCPNNTHDEETFMVYKDPNALTLCIDTRICNTIT